MPRRAGSALTYFVSGLSPDGWMTGEAKLLLKPPDRPEQLQVSFYVPDNAPARLLRRAESIPFKDLHLRDLKISRNPCPK